MSLPGPDASDSCQTAKHRKLIECYRRECHPRRRESRRECRVGSPEICLTHTGSIPHLSVLGSQYGEHLENLHDLPPAAVERQHSPALEPIMADNNAAPARIVSAHPILPKRRCQLCGVVRNPVLEAHMMYPGSAFVLAVL